jgi:hypothetical protein
MSLILEALKKSEAKRRLGEAPDLATPFASPRRRSSALPLLVVAILGAGALGWWLLRTPAPATKPAAAAATASAKPPATSAKRGPATAARPAASTPATAPVKPMPPTVAAPTGQQATLAQTAPGKSAAPPSAATTDKATAKWPPPTAPAQHAQADDNKLHGTLAGKKLPPNMKRVDKPEAGVAGQAEAPAATKPTAVATTANTANSAKAPLAKAPKTPDMLGLTPPDEAKPQSAPEAAALASAAPKPAAPPAPAVVKNDVPFYYELPFNVRKALPPLRLNMHVYAATAAQRFVILNDLRLAEGDKTADEVTLREVRPDGAVLEFQGQRFFYPRDGM